MRLLVRVNAIGRFDRIDWLIGRLAIAVPAVLLVAPLVGPLPAEASSGRVVTGVVAALDRASLDTAADSTNPAEPTAVGDGGHQKCQPHPGEGLNPHCPPPVIPEAPLAVLLPLTAGVVFAAAYWLMRRREAVQPPPA